MNIKIGSGLAALTGLALAVAAFGTVGCGDAKGLSTEGAGKSVLVEASERAPESIEPDASGTSYPLGLPSALKGRAVYSANCATCHGTYLTALEKVAWDKLKDQPAEKWNNDMHQVVDEHRYPADTPAEWLASHTDQGGKALAPNATWAPKNGPDFYSRDWRFQKTPGQLFRMIAFGSDRVVPDGKGGMVPEKDAAGKLLGHLHPGPSGAMGEGWEQSIKDDRGNQMVVANDPAPVWNAVYYVWSRSIAGMSPTRFKEVWDIYGQNCNVCHGTIAKGDGPLSRTLNPMPFNFQNRKALAEQTDEFLFWRISEGGQFTHIPSSIWDPKTGTGTMTPKALNLYVHQWSAMPAWKGVLTEDQRWMAVDGVRSKSYEHE